MKPNLLKEFLNAIPYGRYRDVTSAIERDCNVSLQTIRNWKSGKIEPGFLAKKTINQTVEQLGYEKIYEV